MGPTIKGMMFLVNFWLVNSHFCAKNIKTLLIFAINNGNLKDVEAHVVVKTKRSKNKIIITSLPFSEKSLEHIDHVIMNLPALFHT